VICDINRVIIISTNISSYELQLKNGVPLAPFNENIEDNEL
jgi:TFIIF-interacting CTD phosphatase-like protein